MNTDKYIRSTAISLAASASLAVAGTSLAGPPSLDITFLSADTIVVDCMGSGDYETLQEAVDAAESGDTISVLPCTYFVDSIDKNVDIDSKQLHIVSTEGPDTTFIQIDKTFTILVDGVSPQLTLEGFTISQTVIATNSAVNLLAGELTIDTCHFIDNGSIGSLGGAIYASNFDGLVVVDSYFKNNYATYGGAIYAEDSNPDAVLEIDQTQFISNQVSVAGGALFFDDSPFLITNADFKGNDAASSDGGAIFIGDTKFRFMTGIHDTEFKKNTAADNGGAVSIYDSASEVFFRHCKFNKNSVSRPGSYGGAVQLQYSSAHFEECLFSQNTSEFGGAIDVYTSTAFFFSSDFKKNSANENAGAINIEEAMASFEDVRFVKNNVVYGTGGGANCDWATVEFNNVSFSKNKAFEGGGLFADTSDVTFENGLLEKNKATTLLAGHENIGGAISMIDTSIHFKDLEVLKNKTAQSIGGISLVSCTGKIGKCTIEDNQDHGLKLVDSPTVEIKKTTSCGNDAKDIKGDYIDEGDNTFCKE